MKKDNKKQDMWKIRRLIDDRYYHLSEEAKWDENDKLIETWKLFEKHDYWLTDGSKPIMTSETNTYEDLYKFVKKNRTIDLDRVLGISTMIILEINLIISIINCYLNNAMLRGFILGIDLICIIFVLIRWEVSEKNWKFRMKKLDERWERIQEEMDERWKRR